MSPVEDIIPITYMGGTGGNFLCHLIVSAKRKHNTRDVIKLSEHGNSHDFGMKDLHALSKGISWPDKDKIDYLLSQTPDPKIEKPYYVNCHILDIKTVIKNFKKSIRITYDHDDIPEITNIFYGKWYIDDIVNRNIVSNIFNKSAIRMGLLFRVNRFKKEDVPNILFVSWKELFKGNIDELITKLSIFTGIDSNNFSIESLIHWRNKTQDCIDKFSNLK